MEWKFRETGVDEKLRNPSYEYLFNDRDAHATTPLVRELIQNSLDARLTKSTEPITLRFHRKIVSDFSSAWMEDIAQHLVAEKNGLEADTVYEALNDDATEVLLIEDFNTTGLLGPHDGLPPQASNDSKRFGYYYFTQAEGESGKGAESRGSWGLGKQVLPKASKLNTFFAWTIRSETTTDEPEQLLFGQATLKHHNVNGKNYAPDGVFGSMEDTADGRKLPWPCIDPDDISFFSETVGFQRTSESGLSLCVPYLDTGYTGNNLLRSVISSYYYAIKRGALKVTVIDDIDTLDVSLNIENIDEIISEHDDLDLGESFHEFQQVIRAHLGEVEALPLPAITFEYNEYNTNLYDLIDLEALKSAGQAFEQGEIVKAKIRFDLKGKHPEKSVDGSLTIYALRRLGLGTLHPIFYRDDLHLSEQRNRNRPRDVFMALFVDSTPDNHLAALLRHSENPAHTRWVSPSKRATRHYTYANDVIRRVNQLPIHLVHALNRTRSKENTTALANIFPRTSTLSDFGLDQGKQKPSAPRKPDSPKTPTDDTQSVLGPGEIAVRTPKRYNITHKTGGGIRIAGLSAAAEDYPIELRLEAAYDVAKGNPFKHYNPLDFTLSKEQITKALRGDAVCVRATQNIFVLQLNSPDFELNLSGFDPHRDLVVKPYSKSLKPTSEVS